MSAVISTKAEASATAVGEDGRPPIPGLLLAPRSLPKVLSKGEGLHAIQELNNLRTVFGVILYETLPPCPTAPRLKAEGGAVSFESATGNGLIG